MTTEVINGIEVTDYRAVEEAQESLPGTFEELKEYINRLSDERGAIQQRIDENSEVLKRNDNVGMTGPLLDPEQYPRSDIDLVAVRGARQQVIRLTNDMREVMRQIETALFKLHQTTPTHQHPTPAPPTRDPFLRVTNVLPDSPAQCSGLRDGDMICQIGSLYKANFSSLGDVAEIVKLSLNKAVAVKLIRDDTPRTIALKPRPWAGRGVLGCNVIGLE